MHNIQFRLLPSAAFSLFSPPPLSLSLVLSLALFSMQCFPSESDATTARGFRGYSGKFKLSSKWFFSINASWRTSTSTWFVPPFDLFLSFLSFSFPLTYPFPSAPSSFVWRVIKLATSDGGFNWFHSVCVECRRTRRAAISTDVS